MTIGIYLTRDEWLAVSGAILHYQLEMERMDCPHNIVPEWTTQREMLKKFQGLCSEQLDNQEEQPPLKKRKFRRPK